MRLILVLLALLAPALAEARTYRASPRHEAHAVRPVGAWRSAQRRHDVRRNVVRRSAHSARPVRSAGRVVRDPRHQQRHRQNWRFQRGRDVIIHRAGPGWQRRPGRPARQPSTRSGAVVIGDSIAHGVRGACRCPGRTKVGATPSTVLGYVRNSGSLSGRTVILSSGASNAPSDLGAVEAQLSHLRRSGANVALLGVGPRFSRLNPRLAAMAARHGARFMPIGRTRDGVHPANYAALGARAR